MTNTSKRDCIKMKCLDFLSSITVEPALFLFSLSHGFYVIIVQSLYIAKVKNPTNIWYQ